VTASNRARRDRSADSNDAAERGDDVDRNASVVPGGTRGDGADLPDVQRADPLTKADPALRVALDGEPDATVRAILVLRDPQSVDDAGAAELDPGDYVDRHAWRVAQIDAQRKLIDARYGSALAEMRDRGLKLVGGTVTPVVVVTGDAAAVLDALSHDVVASATFEALS
jgi:hypothetical protein